MELDLASSGSGDEQCPTGQETQSLSKKGTPWSVEEHYAFLRGLEKLGRGNWRGISRFFVPSRTPTQVASHAQKHFLRLGGNTKRRSRFSAIEEELYGSTGPMPGMAKSSTSPPSAAPARPAGPMPGYKAAVAAHVSGSSVGYPSSSRPSGERAPQPRPAKPECAGMLQAPNTWLMAPQYMAGPKPAAGMPASGMPGAPPTMWMPMGWPGMPGMPMAMTPVVTLPGQRAQQQVGDDQNNCFQQQGIQIAVPIPQQQQGMQVAEGIPCMPHPMMYQGYPHAPFFGMPGPYMQAAPVFTPGPVVSYPSPPAGEGTRCPRSSDHNNSQSRCHDDQPAHSGHKHASPASSTSTSTHPTPTESRHSHEHSHEQDTLGTPAQDEHHLGTGNQSTAGRTGPSTTSSYDHHATDVLLAAAAAVEAAESAGNAAPPTVGTMQAGTGGPVCLGASSMSMPMVGGWTPAAVDLLLSQVVPDTNAVIAQAQAHLSPQQLAASAGMPAFQVMPATVA